MAFEFLLKVRKFSQATSVSFNPIKSQLFYLTAYFNTMKIDAMLLPLHSPNGLNQANSVILTINLEGDEYPL